MDLREKIGNIEALSNESEETLESFTFLGIELAIEQGSDVNVLWIVVQVGICTNPKHDRRRLAQRFCSGTELGKHFLL